MKNISTYSMTSPKIFVCFFQSEQMVYFEYTYLDFQGDTLKSNEYGYIDSIVEMPKNYDCIK